MERRLNLFNIIWLFIEQILGSFAKKDINYEWQNKLCEAPKKCKPNTKVRRRSTSRTVSAKRDDTTGYATKPVDKSTP